MSIIRSRRAGNFTVIPNEIINDDALSGDVLGLLAFLLSKPEDWRISIKALAGLGRFGSHGKLTADLRALRSVGYARMRRSSDGSTEWTITDRKGTFDPDSQNRNEDDIPAEMAENLPDSHNRNKGQEPHSDFPHSDFPHSENRNGIQKKDLKQKTEKKTKDVFPCEADGPAPAGEPVPAATPRKRKEPAQPSKSAATWNAYRLAYVARYRVEPLRNAKVNAQLSGFVDRVGADLAPHAAEFYFEMGGFHADRQHPIDLMVRDAETIGAKCKVWIATGKKRGQHHAADNRHDNSAVGKVRRAIAERDRREAEAAGVGGQQGDCDAIDGECWSSPY
jgi:hypothetical protein